MNEDRSASVSGNRGALMPCENVLFFRASPPCVEPLEDEGAIKRKLQDAKHCNMELVTCWPSDSEDLINKLRASTPVVAHLGCHGCKTSERASNSEYDGLVLHSRTGNPFVVSFELVAKYFGFAGSFVKLVVVTACASEPLTKMLLDHVDCTIGVDGLFSDQASVALARGLYEAIGDGASIESAFQAGRLAIQRAGLPGADRLRLNVRDGVDAKQIVIAGPRIRAPRRTSNAWALAAPSE